PDARATADAAKRIGCDPKTQLAPAPEVGVLGTPDPMVLLCGALETAEPGYFRVAAPLRGGPGRAVSPATGRAPPAAAGAARGGAPGGPAGPVVRTLAARPRHPAV